ncbi:hypothetical protein [Paenibacillus illinoisensis]|uniref:hypothetical protein n=1 Tax=Paenibacillus illinoisensis TaxID=59845 RepID=UPI0030164E95
MEKLLFEGYDTLGIGNKIELPKIAEILRSPMFTRADVDDFYRHGGEFNQWLLNQVPITHEYNNICVTVDLKCLTPQTVAMRTTDWHCDGSMGCPYYSFDEKFHILIGYTDLVTEFLAEPAILEADDSVKDLDHYEFRRYIEENKHRIENFKAREIPQDTFVTFNSRHLHRVPDAPSKPCFRFSMIVRESNFDQSNPLEKARGKHSEVWLKDRDVSAINLEHIERGIVLRALNVL